jgi:hypothetical protein
MYDMGMRNLQLESWTGSGCVWTVTNKMGVREIEVEWAELEYTYIPGLVGWLFDWFIDWLVGLLCLVSSGFCCFGPECVELGLFIVRSLGLFALVWVGVVLFESDFHCDFQK